MYNANANDQKSFFTISLLPPYINTVTDTGRALNGRLYSNLLYRFKEYEIIISADELADTTNREFMESFFGANYKYISFYESNAWGDYIEVSNDAGRIPLEYLDGIEYLPEIKIKLIAVAPY